MEIIKKLNSGVVVKLNKEEILNEIIEDFEEINKSFEDDLVQLRKAREIIKKAKNKMIKLDPKTTDKDVKIVASDNGECISWEEFTKRLEERE